MHIHIHQLKNTNCKHALATHFSKLLLSFHPVHISVLWFLLSIFAVWCAQWLAGGSGVLPKYKHRSIVSPARTHPSQGQMATRPNQIKGVFAQKSDKDISQER